MNHDIPPMKLSERRLMLSSNLVAGELLNSLFGTASSVSG